MERDQDGNTVPQSLLANPQFHGGVAQLGEHLLCTQGVSGSSPLTSIKLKHEVAVLIRKSLLGVLICSLKIAYDKLIVISEEY